MMNINEINRIYLGIQGENECREITIDVSAWIAMFPNGSVTIWHKRNGDEVPSPTGATFDADKKTVTWRPTSTDTFVAGEGVAEIRLTDNSVIKKSREIMTGVSPAVTLAGTTLGSDWASYIDAVDGLRSAAVSAKEDAEDAKEDAEDAAEDAEASAEDAEAWAVGQRGGMDVSSDDPTYENNAKYYADVAEDAKDDAETAKNYAEAAQTAAETAAGHGPKIDSVTGNWKTWDAADGQYEDTGVHAQGDAYVLTIGDKEEIAGLVSGMFVVEVTGATPSITGVDNHRYICGTVTEISITPPASGIIDVIFTAGNSCVLTLPETVELPGWFDATSLEQGTVYEINILDGVYGAVTSWA